MVRINQRHLAWLAYQRAIHEADRFSPDKAIRDKLIERCKGMQEAVVSGAPEEEFKDMRQRFESELRVGQEYQRAYQQYEEKQIAAGKDIFDPQFYAAFHAQTGNIATPVGTADFVEIQEYRPLRHHGVVVFGSGCAALLGAVLIVLFERYRSANSVLAGSASEMPRDS